ncbi:hypothetical protein MES4922_300183 [Mesorhizobium ventifaucium]|uniref:Uncharacterized protein n=1 Tax=Mesorhizobium ventifaucium TaxID=666020 RepID=A0ABN8JYF0_9HYPH|nr:hypothetical protein MES4922_300183 [Mesorhizobium ventifaucium]
MDFETGLPASKLGDFPPNLVVHRPQLERHRRVNLRHPGYRLQMSEERPNSIADRGFRSESVPRPMEAQRRLFELCA